jgi:hypothetical protein
MYRTVLFALLVCVVGCASKKSTFSQVGAKIGAARGAADGAPAQDELARQQKEPPADDGKKKGGEPSKRKIVYTASLEVIVEDLDQAASEMLQKLEEHGGYVTHSNEDGTPGSPRQGTWTVRVPAARFDGFRKSLASLGEMRRNKVDSDDVTENYYDTKARIKTLEVEEEGLQKLYLSKSAGSKLDELVTLRKEMRDLRTEIERLQGRVQRWDKDVAFSTATITLRDRKDYVPPLLPDFNSRIGRTFAMSVDALVWVGQALVLTVVALAPWLAIVAILAAPVAIVYRLRSRPKNEPPAAS